MIYSFKFAFVAGCLAVALLSYFKCNSKKDWAWLVAALSFTVIADYFLVLQNNHLIGVAVFCFAHVCYINRTRRVRSLFFVAVAIAAGVLAGMVIAVAVIYAALFAVNIFVNRKARRLFLAGLVLFALCDICVLLFNIPVYFGVLEWLDGVYPLIWVFYLPAQALLAVSACRVGGG